MPELPLAPLDEIDAQRRLYPGPDTFPGPTAWPGVYLYGVPLEAKEEDDTTLTLTPLSES